MKSYLISDSGTETIEFRTNESQFALVHKVNPQSGSGITKTIILNFKELMTLYYAIEDKVLNKK